MKIYRYHLTLIDIFIKENLAIEVGRCFPTVFVVEVLEKLKFEKRSA